MTDMQKIYGLLEQHFIQGDLAGAIVLMKTVPELKETAQAYIDLFEKEQYIRYDIPDDLNEILLCYQQYFRDVFYLRRAHAECKTELLDRLKEELALPGGDVSAVEEELKHRFNRSGYQILCGMTNGYYGPYVWQETVPMTFEVELPETTSRYSINMLRGFIMRSWMDYLTFGERGTGGWASPDGTINCVEKAYDISSEQFQVSLLRHEAQHVEDMKRWNGITQDALEYRAKLVEMIYTQNTNLLEKFCREADAEKTDDSHSVASARIKNEMGGLVSAQIAEIQEKARMLFLQSSIEMEQNKMKIETMNKEIRGKP